MKTKILICIGFVIFCMAIYLAFFKDKKDYQQERMKDLIDLMKQKNEILYDELNNAEFRKRTKREREYYLKGNDNIHVTDPIDGCFKMNNLTIEFMDENQYDFSSDRLEIYKKKINEILVYYEIDKTLRYYDKFDSFLSQISAKGLEKASSLEKQLSYELIKMQIYQYESEVYRKFISSDCCWGNGNYRDDYARF